MRADDGDRESVRVASVEGDITGTERKLWRVCGDGGTGGKLTARATKLESDMTRSNFAIGWKFRQSLSCYIANGRRRAVHPSFRVYMCVYVRARTYVSAYERAGKFATYLNLSSIHFDRLRCSLYLVSHRLRADGSARITRGDVELIIDHSR